MKKLFMVLFVLLISTNAKGEISFEIVTSKCKNTENTHLSDAEIGKAIDKENNCLKQEILKLININISDDEHKMQIKKDFEASIKSAYDFFWQSANYNITCKISSGEYDCGTNGKYLIAGSQLQKMLKTYLQFYIDINDLRATYNID